MPRMATISVLALYNYDDTIFDDMLVPAPLVKDVVIRNILAEYAELEILYPDTRILKDVIGTWSEARIHAWERMVNVLYENYDPFINIKRDEHRVITQTRDLVNTGNSENKVSAWNATDYANRSLNDTTATDKGTITTEETFHVEGDSAITDAQDVLKKEMQVRIEYDMIRIILNEFKERFLLQIY